MIWFTSDTHFGHQKEFLWGSRGFSSSIEHDYAIIDNWNKIVAPDDDVYILGDLMLEDNDHGLDCVGRLNGKLHIIRGNHDTDTRMELYKSLANIIELCEAKTIKIGKQHYFLCHYPTITANYDDKPYHSHLINLFGHTHQNYKFYYSDDPLWSNGNPFMYCVGLDAHENKPVSIEEISADIHEYIQTLYKNKTQEEKERKEYYENGLGYFEKHPLGEEILD